MKTTAAYLLLLVLLAACRQADTTDADAAPNAAAAYGYMLQTNLQVAADSIAIACLPVKDCRYMLYKGDRVVVAQVDVQPGDSTDTVWVKLAHTQAVQGWIGHRQLMKNFIPIDAISQFIYLFSHTHAPYFVGIFALFVALWIAQLFWRRRLPVVYLNDIASLYPLLLCLLMAVSATLYESIQRFAPSAWEHFYFRPTLSPLHAPLLLSLFLGTVWLIIIVLLAALDDIFRLLPPLSALFYLLGLLSACIFCYFFFIWSTPYYIGYLFLAVFVLLFALRLRHVLRQGW
jgi:hypothetical protein